MSIRIRRTNDAERVRALHTICFPKDHWPTPTDRHAMWIATDDEGDVGFCTAKKLGGIDEGTVFLERAGVRKRGSGKGIQRRMIRIREAWAKAQGATSVVTYTVPSNYESIVNLIKSDYRFFAPSVPWATRKVHYFQKIFWQPHVTRRE